MNDRDQVSEAIERAALLSLHEHCPARTHSALGLFLEEVADGVVAGASKDPSILLNRTLGLGTSVPVTTATINSVHTAYESRGVGRYFLHVYPEGLADGPDTFNGTPLRRTRGWMKFHRGNEPAMERATDLRVERVGAEGARDFGRIVALAFGLTEPAAELLAGLVHDPRWYLFVSYLSNQAAGAGAMFVDKGSAWFEWGATDPAFRRRGSQGAIMTARLRTALDLGCHSMFTETGEAVENDPQHSYRNILRYGFKEGILRENWAPPAR